MAHTTHRARPEPAQHMDTVSDIDEALLHTTLSAMPRGDHWWRWVNGLLDERNRLARTGPRRETRVLHPTEYRDA
jgi:hypothetical protein